MCEYFDSAVNSFWKKEKEKAEFGLCDVLENLGSRSVAEDEQWRVFALRSRRRLVFVFWYWSVLLSVQAFYGELLCECFFFFFLV